MSLCAAICDCEADFIDELSFQEGEILVILKSVNENWFLVLYFYLIFQGHKENCEKLGIFPKSFITFDMDAPVSTKESIVEADSPTSQVYRLFLH